MRYANIVICIAMVLFAAVQYNDPDAPLWIAVYLAAAFWSGVAGFRLAALRDNRMFAALGATLLVALAGTAYYWPDVPGWWHREVWWEVETAREGMGMMLATLAVLIALLAGLRGRSRPATDA